MTHRFRCHEQSQSNSSVCGNGLRHDCFLGHLETHKSVLEFLDGEFVGNAVGRDDNVVAACYVEYGGHQAGLGHGVGHPNFSHHFVEGCLVLFKIAWLVAVYNDIVEIRN